MILPLETWKNHENPHDNRSSSQDSKPELPEYGVLQTLPRPSVISWCHSRSLDAHHYDNARWCYNRGCSVVLVACETAVTMSLFRTAIDAFRSTASAWLCMIGFGRWPSLTDTNWWALLFRAVALITARLMPRANQAVNGCVGVIYHTLGISPS
jgi:hypothetical protein